MASDTTSTAACVCCAAIPAWKTSRSKLENLGKALYREVPSGVGKGGRLKLKGDEFDQVLTNGAARLVELEYGQPEDLEAAESGGRLSNADAKLVSQDAKDRAFDQLGTMGSGNHFVEVDVVQTIYDQAEAERLNIFEGQIVVLDPHGIARARSPGRDGLHPHHDVRDEEVRDRDPRSATRVRALRVRRRASAISRRCRPLRTSRGPIAR